MDDHSIVSLLPPVTEGFHRLVRALGVNGPPPRGEILLPVGSARLASTSLKPKGVVRGSCCWSVRLPVKQINKTSTPGVHAPKHVNGTDTLGVSQPASNHRAPRQYRCLPIAIWCGLFP